MYAKFNPLYEIDRLKLYLNRDGIEEALGAARRMIRIYLSTTKAYRTKPGGRKHPYRYGYLESAYSARYIIRNKLLEKLVENNG